MKEREMLSASLFPKSSSSYGLFADEAREREIPKPK